MKKWIYRFLMIVCACVFAYSAYNLYLIYAKKGQQDVAVEEIKEETVIEDEVEGFKVDWKAMKEKNSDIVAWIYVPDCDISFPVVQAEDNGYYLDYDINKQYNELGSIFLDYENEKDFSDFNSIIYGHSVQGTGGMFTDLKKYAKKDFFDKHDVIYLFTPEGNFKGNVLCFAKAEDRSIYYDQEVEKPDEHISELKKKALYSNDIDTDGNLLTLSTCDLDYGLYGVQRLILVAVLEPTTEPIVVK